MPSKRKKDKPREVKKEGRKESKKYKSDCCVTFKVKNYLKILLSAHARTSQPTILYLDQKAAKCMTYKQLCVARQ